MLTFNLNCKPYVKHYLEHCFGSPIYLRHDSVIGKYFFQLVDDASITHDKICDKKLVPEYPSVATIKITQDVFLRRGCVLTKTNQRNFNVFVEDYFKKQLYLILDTVSEINQMKIREAIDYAYDKFDMDESVFPMETMVKAYYRERKQRNELRTK